MMQRSLYPVRWPELRQKCLADANYQCELCGVRQGSRRKSKRTGKRYTVYLAAAHRNGDAWNSSEDVQLMCLCQRCHMNYDARLHQARRRALRLSRQGRMALHAPLATARVYRGTAERASSNSLAIVSTYQEIAQVIATSIPVGDICTVILEMNQVYCGHGTYLKTSDGVIVLEEIGASEGLSLSFGVSSVQTMHAQVMDEDRELSVTETLLMPEVTR